MSESEFEKYVCDLGYENVAIDEDIELRNGVDIIMEYLNDHQYNRVITLRDVYNQLMRMTRGESQ